MKKDELKNYLKRNCLGKSNAVSGERLRHILHISENEVRKLVNRLRREGVPIASDQTGYYYALTGGEVLSTLRHLDKMRAGLEAASRGLEGCLDNFGERGRE